MFVKLEPLKDSGLSQYSPQAETPGQGSANQEKHVNK